MEVCVLREGDHFGDTDLTQNNRRESSAVTLTKTQFLILRMSDLKAFKEVESQNMNKKA